MSHPYKPDRFHIHFVLPNGAVVDKTEAERIWKLEQSTLKAREESRRVPLKGGLGKLIQLGEGLE